MSAATSTAMGGIPPRVKLALIILACIVGAPFVVLWVLASVFREGR